jgi:hypothetical protein
VAPVDLLAGLAPGVELEADDLPPGIGDDESTGSSRAVITVGEAGRQVRAGDGTIRRMIRGRDIVPRDGEPRAGDVARAGVLPRTPDKPGE